MNHVTNEEYALVIDYMPRGKSISYKEESLAQLIGTEYFTLLEVIPKTELKTFEKVYVGKEEREKIQFIKKRIVFKELTSNAVSELQNSIEKIIDANTERFLDFYNKAGSITIRRHQLELLPGLGKKHLADLLNEREKQPFKSFEDIEKRVTLMPNPKGTLVKRIVKELEGEDIKHYLFVRPPKKEKSFTRFRRTDSP